MDKLSVNIEKINYEIRKKRLIELGSVYRAKVKGYNDEIPEYDWWDELHDEDLNRVFPLAETKLEKILGMYWLYSFITWGDPHDESDGRHAPREETEFLGVGFDTNGNAEVYVFPEYDEPDYDKIDELYNQTEWVKYCFTEHTFDCLYLSGGYIYPNHRKQSGFTDIQKQVFQLKLLGKTEQDIADILKITQQGVNKCTKLIKNKENKCWKNYQLQIDEMYGGGKPTTKLGRHFQKQRKEHPYVPSWRK